MELLQVGDKIFDRIEIEQNHGAGGQSFGFIGVDHEAPADQPWLRRVFVKQYHDVIRDSDDWQKMGAHFESLHQRLGQRAHYLCLPLLVGDARGSTVAVFPFIQGIALEEHLSSNLSVELRVRFALAFSNVVRILHKSGIAHLDLKPENILIEHNEKSGKYFLRLIDTDACQIDGVGIRSVIYGTEGYMAPEYRWPKKFGGLGLHSDVFALGIILCEILFDRFPFEGEDIGDAVLNNNFIIPDIGLPEVVVERVRSCLSAKPWDRPSAGQVHSVLHENRERIFVCLEGKGGAPRDELCLHIWGDEFERFYFDEITLGRRNFLGVGIPDLPREFLRITFESHMVVVELRSNDVNILCDGRLVRAGERLRVKNAREFVVNGVRLIFSAA